VVSTTRAATAGARAEASPRTSAPFRAERHDREPRAERAEGVRRRFRIVEFRQQPGFFDVQLNEPRLRAERAQKPERELEIGPAPRAQIRVDGNGLARRDRELPRAEHERRSRGPTSVFDVTEK